MKLTAQQLFQAFDDSNDNGGCLMYDHNGDSVVIDGTFNLNKVLRRLEEMTVKAFFVGDQWTPEQMQDFKKRWNAV